MRKKLIIVNGAPGSGKTTIVSHLRTQLDITIIEKDAIKEFFFDYVGFGDREWSRMLGKVAIDTLFRLAAQLFAIKDVLIIETAFYASVARQDIAQLVNMYDIDILELYCRADESVRQERFTRRARRDRHPGHADLLNPNELIDTIERYAPLDIGEIMHIDTNNAVDMNSIMRVIEDFVKKENNDKSTNDRDCKDVDDAVRVATRE